MSKSKNKSYSIGDVSFKTKKECLEYTRETIKKLGCCIVDKSHGSFNFLKELLEQHPDKYEKIDCGIDYFYIEKIN